MGCGCACSSKSITEEQKKILEAMEQCSGPCTTKEVAGSISMDTKVVSKEISALKKQGFADSPVRCKHGITDAGRQIIGK